MNVLIEQVGFPHQSDANSSLSANFIDLDEEGDEAELQQSVERNSATLKSLKNYMSIASFEITSQESSGQSILEPTDNQKALLNSINQCEFDNIYRVKNPLRILKRLNRFAVGRKDNSNDINYSQ